MRLLLLLLAIASLSAAATHNGDGTFKLYPNQSIESFIHYVVVLTAVGTHAGADLMIYDGNGTSLTNITLAPNETYNATYSGSVPWITKMVLSVKLISLGTDAASGGGYAIVKVSSADFGPLPQLNVTSVTITPRKYDATVEWTTNDGANGTVLVYAAGSGVLVNSSADPLSLESHGLRVGGLQPDTAYSVVVEACDMNCTLSEPQQMRTLGGENRTAANVIAPLNATAANGSGNASLNTTLPAPPSPLMQAAQPPWALIAAAIFSVVVLAAGAYCLMKKR